MPVLDLARALEAVEGDEELLRELAELFLEDFPRMVEEIRAAAADRDAAGLHRAAHTLKGSVAVLGAPAVGEIAYALECAGRAEDLDAAPPLLERLDQAAARLSEALGELLAG